MECFLLVKMRQIIDPTLPNLVKKLDQRSMVSMKVSKNSWSKSSILYLEFEGPGYKFLTAGDLIFNHLNDLIVLTNLMISVTYQITMLNYLRVSLCYLLLILMIKLLLFCIYILIHCIKTFELFFDLWKILRVGLRIPMFKSAWIYIHLTLLLLGLIGLRLHHSFKITLFDL